MHALSQVVVVVVVVGGGVGVVVVVVVVAVQNHDERTPQHDKRNQRHNKKQGTTVPYVVDTFYDNNSDYRIIV